MRNKIIILILFIISFNSIKAQTDSIYIVKPKWKKGEVKTMTEVLTRTFKMDSINEIYKPDTVSICAIKVLDVLKDGYILEYKQRFKDAKNKEFENLKINIDKFNYIIEVDTIGKIKEIKNSESLLEVIKDLKKLAKKEAKKDKSNKIIYEYLFKEIDNLDSKEELIEACKNKTKFFLGIYGEHLKLYDSVSMPTIEPDKVIKEGIPLIKITVTKKIDEDRFNIKHSDIYDKTKTKILIDKYYPGVDLDSAVTTSYSFYIYNNKTTWVEKIIFYVQYQDTSWGYTNITTYTIE